ncbi:MAG: hypothetical protein U1E29_06100 [Coriobacteriia bacterium]|nr:hypothetical protein [Coriobacteriia bacterium]
MSEHGRIETLTGSHVCVRHEVSVAVNGRGDRRVPQLLLDVLQVLTLVDEQRRERVPQIVNPHSAESGDCQRGFKHPMPQVRLVDEPTVCGAEHEIVLTPRRAQLVVHEDRCQPGGHANRAD